MATSVIISQLPPPPNEIGSGVSKGTDLFPATDITDTSSASTGTTNKYTLSEIYNFFLNAEGLATYQAVRVATTGALSVTYTNGTLGVGAQLTNAGAQAALVIDGVTLSIGDRILVKDQVSQLQNGIYTVTNVGSISTNWIMTRATDYDTTAEVIQYGVILSNQGTLNAGKLWQETGPGPFSIGTTAIIFAPYTSQSVSLPILLSEGGTSASLTASNGGIFYSTASAGAILSGTSSPNQLLQSGANSAPSWTSLVGGTGITISPAANTITISAVATGLSWSTISGTTQLAIVDNGFIVGNSGQTTITLPASFLIGQVVEIKGLGAGGWILTANSGQTIGIGQATTSPGGTLTSAGNFDTVRVTGLVANTTWSVDYAFSTGLTYA